MHQKIHLRPNDTIVFIGDSITATERHRQAYRPLGYGYVHFAGNFLLAKYPELNLSIINSGINGDTLVDLKRRWRQDCIAHRPNVLSVMVGINDAWQLTTAPVLAATAPGPDEYELTYEQLLEEARQRSGCRLVLMEPFMFCRDPRNAVFRALMPYVEAVRRLASKYDAVLVALQSEVDQRIAAIPPERWSEDTVHPFLWAQAWIAQRWLEATGL